MAFAKLLPVTALLALGACGSGASNAPPAPAADAELAPAVRAAFDEVLDAVRAAPDDAGAWRTLGETYEANGFPTLAAAAYAGATERDPDDARAWHHLARVRTELGELDEAVRAARRAAELAPRHAPAHWRLGNGLLELGRVDEAETAFALARNADPLDPGGAWGLARVALERGDSAAALAALEDAGKRPYTHVLRASAHRLAGDSAAAAREAARGGLPTWHDPWSDAIAERRAGWFDQVARAREAVARGDLATARSLLEALHRTERGDLNVACMLADVYLASRRPTDALGALRATREARGEHYLLDLQESVAHDALGAAQPALAAVERSIRLFDQHGPAHLLRGRYLLRAARHEEGLAAIDEARRLGADGADVYLHRGRALGMLERWPEAVQEYSNGARAYPDAVVLPLAEAEARANAGDVGGAWAAHRRAAALEPSHPLVEQLAGELEAAFGPAPGDGR